jgi:hypothetical protein
LAATLATSDESPDRAVVLVHGGGVTREEGGFFTRIASGLAEAGTASLRFDLRGHGESDGRQEDLTLTTILNDIRVALASVQEATGASRLTLLGASFSGGVCAYYAAKRPMEIDRLVLLNPQLGYIQFTPSLRHGYGVLNEVFWFKPLDVLGEIAAPTLLVHGTKDTFVPIELTRAALPRFRAEHRLVEIEGSQHGFAVHDDPQYLSPHSQQWQAFVIRTVADWVTASS